MASDRSRDRVIQAFGIALAVAVSLPVHSPMLMASNCDDFCSGTRCCDTPCCDNSCHCEHMLGDWAGIRPAFEEHGIEIESFLTQFYQGVASGGSEQRFRYGAKFDVYMDIDTGKLGLWENGTFDIHFVDWQFGRNSIEDATGLAPANMLLVTPHIDRPSFGLTHLLYEHEIGGGWLATVGRANQLDLLPMFFPDLGRGLDGFMNISALAPLSMDPSIPLIANTAGFVKKGERGFEAAFLVLESLDAATTVGLDFPNGVSFMAAARKYTDFGRLPGSHTLVGTYATGDYTSFDTEGWVIDPPNGIVPAEKAGSWAAMYFAEQRLWQDQCRENRYNRLYGYVGFSDIKNSPFQWTGSISWESFGPRPSRPHDRMGIAYFYNALNSDFQNAFSLVTPIGDVHGGEVYYNAEITPWFHVTADIQVIDPEIEAQDTALVLGLRAKLTF